MSQSILDQVLSSQKMSAISQFDPESMASKIFSSLSDREREILTKRHGLDGKERLTLEEIGKRYSVTRERIRQVENATLNRIREQFKETLLKDAEYLIQNILEDHGDLMSENRLVQQMLATETAVDTSSALIRFLLNQLLHDRIQQVREDEHVYKAWSTSNLSWESYHAIIAKMIAIIEKSGEPMRLDDLLEQSREVVKLEKESDEHFEQILLNYLDVTKKIEENKFNEWGLSHWNSIRPRRMNDKIYMILKKEAKPLHFVEIAQRINDAQFDKRIAYPATIHNELILDDKYVLVGRGIYALKEWGYKPGVVLDVIKGVLKESNKPLSRDQIVELVLKNRMVKRSTVILALMNKKNFTKTPDGLYTLAA